MCEYLDRIKPFVPVMAGKSIDELFPPYVTAKFPYHRTSQGCCLVCGRPLSALELHPPGRTSRSLCESCYTELIVNTINYFCFICNGGLPNDKVMLQKKYPREIAANIHDRYCLDYFNVHHAKIAGKDMGFLKDEQSEYLAAYRIKTEIELVAIRRPAGMAQEVQRLPVRLDPARDRLTHIPLPWKK